MRNCQTDFCKYCVCDFAEEYSCKLDCKILDDDNWDCIYFEPRQRCDDCEYAKVVTYETGTIDEIDYYCKLQGDRLIYQDVSFNVYDYFWPDCPIDSFKPITHD